MYLNQTQSQFYYFYSISKWNSPSVFFPRLILSVLMINTYKASELWKHKDKIWSSTVLGKLILKEPGGETLSYFVHKTLELV